MTELWLVRHGQTDWNLTGRWQGQAQDAPGLNEAGIAQVRELGAQLAGIRFSAVYTSDQLRARQTAELLAEPLGLTVTLEPRLREINLGLWEGMLSTEIEARFLHELEQRKLDPWHTRAPEGESPREVAGRVLAAVDEISRKHRQEAVLVVAHGLSLAVVICRAEGIPPAQVYEHVPDNVAPRRVDW